MRALCWTLLMGSTLLGLGAEAAVSAPGDTLEEVIVTAEKRSERLQDVPVPVTALDPVALTAGGLDRLEDYYTSVPGLSLTNSGDGRQTIAIRGLTTGGITNPTVGVVVDDVPYGSSTAQGLGGSTFPDIDPADLSQIELLRGPQGTLYGASSMGGLLKFVTQDPSTTKLSGRVQLQGSDVTDGQAGYGVRGSVNVPVSDSFAIRASGFARHEPGSITNVTTGERYVDSADVRGGRVVAMWHLSETTSLRLAATVQETAADGVSQVDTNMQLQPTLGDLKQARLRGTGANSLDIQTYSATLATKLGGLDFLSLTGYGLTKHQDLTDYTPSLGFLSDIVFPGTTGSSLLNDYPTAKFSQEFRLSSPSGGSLDWRVGAFYTHENSNANQALFAVDPATGSVVGLVGNFHFPTTFTESAVYGDLTFNINDRFDIQVGGRESQIHQVFNETDSGPYVPLAFGTPSPNVYPEATTTNNSFTYLFTPRYRISPDLMVYARLASGYRSGGPNPAAAVFNLPYSYDPDKNYDYDLGIKGALFDHQLTFDASLYYIDWKNIQLQLLDPASQFAYFANAGNAKSQGLELALQATPLRGLKIAATASFNDAQLTQDLPPGTTAVASAGDQLPYSSHFSGSVSVDQDIATHGSAVVFVGGTVSYVGPRLAEFAATAADRLQLPSYTATDLRGGVRFDAWTADLFVNNVGNERGVLAESSLGGPAFAATYIQPRTIGLSVTRTF